MEVPEIIESKISFEFGHKDYNEIESYMLTKDKIIFWTDTFYYILIDLFGKKICEGCVNVDSKQDICLTRIYCNWFCSHNQLSKILYLSFTDEKHAIIRACDLMNPQMTSKIWAKNFILNIDSSKIHQFC